MPEGADLSALIHRSVGMGDVLDDVEMMAVGDLHDGIHIAGIAEIVNDHDRFGLGRDAPLQVLRVKAQLVVDVAENGRSAEIHGLGNAAPIGLGGADDLIAQPKPDGKHRRRQRHGAVGEGEGIFSALPRGKFILKLDGDIGSRKAVVDHHVHGGVDILLGQNGPFEQFGRGCLGNERGAAEKCCFAHRLSSCRYIRIVLF